MCGRKTSMVTGRQRFFSCAANFLRGPQVHFSVVSFQVLHTRRGYVKMWGAVAKSKSLRRLRREIRKGFLSIYRLSQDLGLDVKVVTRVYHRVREALYHVDRVGSRQN